MDLPNYQNVALKNLPASFEAPSNPNSLPNEFVSARDRRLADREAKRRDRKQQQTANKTEEYLKSLQEPPKVHVKLLPPKNPSTLTDTPPPTPPTPPATNLGRSGRARLWRPLQGGH